MDIREAAGLKNVGAISPELDSMKKQADLLKIELRVAIGKWIDCGRTTASFDQMVDAFDTWKLAKWQYDRAFDRCLNLSPEWR